MLRGGSMPTGAVCVRANWRDNPKFPKVLEQERLDCLRLKPEQYEHIWEGGYATVLEGRTTRSRSRWKAENRIGKVAADPLLTIRLFCDIGGTGARRTPSRCGRRSSSGAKSAC
jgi:phage terminase large subunit